ncbi:MAG: DUF5618 family protein [Nitrospirota bacterium]
MAKEALRYLQNAKEMLREVPIENNTYIDVKPVQEACGTAYLAVLKAIDEYLIKRGIGEKELPQSTEGYREMLMKYLSIYDGKLRREFEKLYKLLHIAGYYRGLLEDVNVVKDAIKAARVFIGKIP